MSKVSMKGMVVLSILLSTFLTGCLDSATQKDGTASGDDTEAPRVVSAGAVDNATILVTFSESMQGGESAAENPAHYRIGADPNYAQEFPAAEVIVRKAELILPEQTTVRLTTYSQSAIHYQLTVTNVKDLAGNVIKAPEGSDAVVNPSQTAFTGIAPSGGDVVDTDGDGLSDADEQLGWNVVVTTANGEQSTTAVTSDPTVADTDNDGVNDNEEKHGAINPRSADTDGDTISDNDEWNTVLSDATKQDTDGDGAQDGFEYYTFRTSPILADTDGDQLSDTEEVAAGNRNPLLADLPQPRISVGNINLQLDTHFAFTNEIGETHGSDESTEATLTQSNENKYATSNEFSSRKTLEFSQEIGTKYNSGGGVSQAFPGWETHVTVGFQQNFENGHTFSASNESARATEDSYQKSLTSSVSSTATETVTREVTGASVKASVTIENLGDIPFAISNLELSALKQDPNDRSQFIPVASLVPENANQSQINVGAFGATPKGPFVFATGEGDALPEEVEELMKNPRGLIVQLANYDIVDEVGRNFAFSSQEVIDRTAGLTFDLGDGRVETYRVATASAHDSRNGKPLGISMGYALNGIIGLQPYTTIRDGGNGQVETTAAGDDIQQEPPGNTVEAGVVLISAGENGELDTTPAGDDEIVQADYASAVHTLADSIVDGGNGVVETDVAADDIQELPLNASVKPGQLIATAGINGTLDTTPAGDDVIVKAPQPYRVLSRFHDVESDASKKQFWVLFTSAKTTPTDLDKRTIRAGEQYDFTFVQDQDGDGVWAREEYLYGSSDLIADSDGDGLSDRVEIKEGWNVAVKGDPNVERIYPSPNQADSDRDTLTDAQERECELDARQRDTDQDGLTDWEELFGRVLVDGGDEAMKITDPDTNVTTTIVPYAGCKDGSTPGENGCADGFVPHENKSACDIALGISGFATDPLNPDTDGDFILDGKELTLNINPNDASDGPLFLDDDGDGIANKIEIAGWDSRVKKRSQHMTSDPNDPDSDDDGLPDLLEYMLGSNPQSTDTDGDGLLDQDEFNGPDTCARIPTGDMKSCEKFSERAVNNYSDFVNRCQAAASCSFDVSSYLGNYGTSLMNTDSDQDGIGEKIELRTDVSITVNGENVALGPNLSFSDPLTKDTDGDGLRDGDEYSSHSNPRQADTDEDGTNDKIEFDLGTSLVDTDGCYYLQFGAVRRKQNGGEGVYLHRYGIREAQTGDANRELQFVHQYDNTNLYVYWNNNMEMDRYNVILRNTDKMHVRVTSQYRNSSHNNVKTGDLYFLPSDFETGAQELYREITTNDGGWETVFKVRANRIRTPGTSFGTCVGLEK